MTTQCPDCNSTDIHKNREHQDTLGIVCVCVECEGTWIAGEEKKTFCPGENRRAMRRQIEQDEFIKDFNENW